jgi:2-aminobenzoate-CoA ligase
LKDRYPDYAAVPVECVVPPELQPAYEEVPGVRVGPDANVAAWILDRARRADDIALIAHESGRSLSFQDLAAESNRLANALDGLGVQPGERVAFRSPNRPEAIITALACWRIGAIVVPTPVQARAAELRFLLNDTGTTRLVCSGSPSVWDEVPEALAGTGVKTRIVFGESELAPGWLSWERLLADARPTWSPRAVPADSIAFIWHTGGTTGVPKACYHTQRRFLAGGASYGLATGSGPGQRWAIAAPVGHGLAFIYYTIFTLLHGAGAVMIEEFRDAETVLRAIGEHRVDTFTAIAATWGSLTEAIRSDRSLDRLDSLRRAYSMWQSASSTEIYDTWRERGIELLNNFGSTAFATWILVPRPGESFPPASLGRASPGYQVIAIEDESGSVDPLEPGVAGRMAVRGPTGLTYWNRPEAQQRDVREGWSLSDDLIRLDENGNAAYLGRTDFIISSAGYKIAPVEVEEVLARHPAVREVAVVGTPDPVRQEVVTAFIALAAGVAADDALRVKLQEFVQAELAPYKYPRRVEFVDALPRDPVGKVQPRVLQALARERASSRS